MKRYSRIILFTIVITAFIWGLFKNVSNIEALSNSSSNSDSSSVNLEKGSDNSISQLCGGQCETNQICITQGSGANMSYCCKNKPISWSNFGNGTINNMQQFACKKEEVTSITSAPVISSLSASAEYSDGEKTYLSQFT